MIEVLSPETAARDRVEKRDLYSKHGVGEYWIVDPETAQTLMYRRTAPAAGFADPVRVEGASSSRCEVLPRLEIDWRSVFAD